MPGRAEHVAFLLIRMGGKCRDDDRDRLVGFVPSPGEANVPMGASGFARLAEAVYDKLIRYIRNTRKDRGVAEHQLFFS